MESSIVREAEVFWGDELAGRIEQTARESTFRYATSFGETPLPGRGIAFRLPRNEESFVVPGTFQHTFFANLLPEGFRLNAVRSRIRASSDDALSILLQVGADTIGNVTVVAVGKSPHSELPSLAFDDLAKVDLFLLLEKDISANVSIPGVQEKLSDQIVSFTAKVGSTAAIVKLNPPAYPLLVANEHFFMGMARGCGLRAAETELRQDGSGNQALLVRRFDRTAHGKLHQEDGCQFLDVYPGAKYSVSLRDIAQGITRFATGGPIQLRRLLQLVAFSYVIGNGDLHAKNISLYRSEKGLIELTPAYDLLSTLPYPKMDQSMALKVEGKDSNLKRAFLCRFFGSLGLPQKASTAVLDRICDSAPAWIDRVDEIGYDVKTTEKLRRAIRARRDQLGTAE
jgi:serine/threonine-protein kinase HipA